MGYGAIAGAVIGGLTSYLSSRGSDEGKIRRRGMNFVTNTIGARDRHLFSLAQRQAEAVPGEIARGYRLARREVGGAFRSSMRGAIEQGERARGDAMQRMSNAGFSGASSVAANMRLGVGYGTSRAIQNVQDRLAQIGANLATGEGRDMAAARGSLGQFYMQRARSERERDMLTWQLLTGMQPSNPGGAIDLSGLGQLFSLFGNNQQQPQQSRTTTTTTTSTGGRSPQDIQGYS